MTLRFNLYPVACAAIIIAGAIGAPRAAHAQLFDFENQAATFISPPATVRAGSLTSLAMTSGALTLTITRPNAARFDIVDNTTANQNEKPAAFGNRSLDPFFDTADNGTGGTGANGFIGNFSSGVTNISLDFGDYGASDSDILTLSAFSGLNGTGTLLGTNTINIGGAGFLNPTPQFPAGFGTAFVGAANIRSFTINSTSDSPGNNNSVFIDNIRGNAAAAPEPGTMALLLGAGGPAFIGGVAYRLRRRRK